MWKIIEDLTGETKRKKIAAEKVAAEKIAAEKIAAEAAAALLSSAKDFATRNKEPYVEVLSINIDADNPGEGSFELDWNDIFVAKLVRAGYQGDNDQDIVDQWFRTICKHVVLETYEQGQADLTSPNHRVNKKDIGDGRSEIS